jgi:hypothetical protein
MDAWICNNLGPGEECAFPHAGSRHVQYVPLQLLSYPLSNVTELLWHHTVLQPICFVLSVLCLRDAGSKGFEMGLTLASFVWSASVVAVFGQTCVASAAETPPPPWFIKVSFCYNVQRSLICLPQMVPIPTTFYWAWFRSLSLQVLRHATRLSTSVLFVPLLTNLLRPFDCEGTWLDSGFTCFQSTHLALTLLGLLCAIGLTLFAVIGTMLIAFHWRSATGVILSVFPIVVWFPCM